MAVKLQATTTATVTTAVKLETKAHQMLRARCEEHAQLAITIKSAKSRQDRIKGEVEELFKKAKQGKALADGTEIEGHKLKMVCGTTSKFDKFGFMKKHGLSEDDFAEFTTQEPNKPYIKISAPGGGKE